LPFVGVSIVKKGQICRNALEVEKLSMKNSLVNVSRKF
jgi:hypothetical protein